MNFTHVQGFGDGETLPLAVTALGNAPLAALAALATHLLRLKASSELGASSAVVPYEVQTISDRCVRSPLHMTCTFCAAHSLVVLQHCPG